MENILKVENLTRSFSDFTLDHVNFHVPKGCIMGFIGENGSGKTTTMKLILNLLHRDSGKIEIFGLDNQKDEQKIKSQIGVVFAECLFHEVLTPAEIGKILSGIYHTWDQKLFTELSERFSIAPKKKIKELSTGTRRKLSIAAALSHHPKLLLLDEPTSGLDPVVRNEIMDLFLEFIQDEEHAILFSSHITSDLEKAADYITFLHEGKVTFSKNKDSLLYDYGILKCSADDARHIEKSDIVRRRDGSYGCDILVADQRRAAAKYHGMVIDRPTLEDIMLFYTGRDSK